MIREDELSFLKEFSKDEIIKKSKSSLLDVLDTKNLTLIPNVSFLLDLKLEK